MGWNAGARAVCDTGSTTGVATAILALLSAGTVVSISLVGAHQLAPAGPEHHQASKPFAVHSPATVVVTPHAAAPTASSEAVTHRHAAKPRTSSPSGVTVVPAVLTSPAVQHTRVRTSRVPLPSVHVAPPAVTIPAVTIPAVTTPAVTIQAVASGPGYPNVVSTKPDQSRSVDAYKPSLLVSVAVPGGKTGRSRGDGNPCGVPAGGDHQDVYVADRGRDLGDSHHGRHDH